MEDVRHIANALQSSVSFITKACGMHEKEERVRNGRNATSVSVCKSERSPESWVVRRRRRRRTRMGMGMRTRTRTKGCEDGGLRTGKGEGVEGGGSCEKYMCCMNSII
jgi:hypothetical protein